MSNGLDEKLAKALAVALSQTPRASLQQIAKRAGISKATLYRLAPTRESLIKMLLERSGERLHEVLQSADLASPPFFDALSRLTNLVLGQREFYMFWNTAHWVQMLDAEDAEPEDPYPSFYGQALEAFFFRGQKSGAIRIDVSAKWLAKSYDYLIHAAADAAQRGEVATIGMPDMVLKMFLLGASESPQVC